MDNKPHVHSDPNSSCDTSCMDDDKPQRMTDANGLRPGVMPTKVWRDVTEECVTEFDVIYHGDTRIDMRNNYRLRMVERLSDNSMRRCFIVEKEVMEQCCGMCKFYNRNEPAFPCEHPMITNALRPSSLVEHRMMEDEGIDCPTYEAKP